MSVKHHKLKKARWITTCSMCGEVLHILWDYDPMEAEDGLDHGHRKDYVRIEVHTGEAVFVAGWTFVCLECYRDAGLFKIPLKEKK